MPVVTVNYVRRESIDDFQIQVKWTSEGQRPIEAASQVDPGCTVAQVGGNGRNRGGEESSRISRGTSLREAQH
jgi:hypothetical protein